MNIPSRPFVRWAQRSFLLWVVVALVFVPFLSGMTVRAQVMEAALGFATFTNPYFLAVLGLIAAGGYVIYDIQTDGPLSTWFEDSAAWSVSVREFMLGVFRNWVQIEGAALVMNDAPVLRWLGLSITGWTLGEFTDYAYGDYTYDGVIGAENSHRMSAWVEPTFGYEFMGDDYIGGLAMLTLYFYSPTYGQAGDHCRWDGMDDGVKIEEGVFSRSSGGGDMNTGWSPVGDGGAYEMVVARNAEDELIRWFMPRQMKAWYTDGVHGGVYVWYSWERASVFDWAGLEAQDVGLLVPANYGEIYGVTQADVAAHTPDWVVDTSTYDGVLVDPWTDTMPGEVVEYPGVEGWYDWIAGWATTLAADLAAQWAGLRTRLDALVGSMTGVWAGVAAMPAALVAVVVAQLVPTVTLESRVDTLASSLEGVFPLVVVDIFGCLAGAFDCECVPWVIELPDGFGGTYEIDLTASAGLTDVTFAISGLAAMVMGLMYCVSLARRFLGLGE